MSVTATSSSYLTLFNTFSKEYSDTVPASALLWWWLDSVDKFGVRVECPSLGKEFSNGMYIGRDPEGTLFYNDALDFSNPDGGPLNAMYNVYYNTDNTAPAFVIEWYNIGATSSQCFAKFLAKDPNRVAKNRIISAQQGVWTDAATSESFARLNKTSTTVNTWTLKVNSIHKKVTFPTSGQVTTTGSAKRVDTMGILIWKDINRIPNGVYVDYRDDRIVFTETSEWSTDFCAFFLPVENAVNENPLGNYVIRAGGAQWSAL